MEICDRSGTFPNSGDRFPASSVKPEDVAGFTFVGEPGYKAGSAHERIKSYYSDLPTRVVNDPFSSAGTKGQMRACVDTLCALGRVDNTIYTATGSSGTYTAAINRQALCIGAILTWSVGKDLSRVFQATITITGFKGIDAFIGDQPATSTEWDRTLELMLPDCAGGRLFIPFIQTSSTAMRAGRIQVVSAQGAQSVSTLQRVAPTATTIVMSGIPAAMTDFGMTAVLCTAFSPALADVVEMMEAGQDFPA